MTSCREVDKSGGGLEIGKAFGEGTDGQLHFGSAVRVLAEVWVPKFLIPFTLGLLRVLCYHQVGTPMGTSHMLMSGSVWSVLSKSSGSDITSLGVPTYDAPKSKYHVIFLFLSLQPPFSIRTSPGLVKS